ncbi:MAG: MBL fold metallo-hydrolase [Chlamydiales bacterium]
MKGSFLFLGTGSSMGIPVLLCECSVCKSPSPHNKRQRTAGVITLGSKKILLDSGPDFREQALQYEVDHLDGMILTHSHFDHVGGFDDLRVFSYFEKGPFPVLLFEETYSELTTCFPYLAQIDPFLPKQKFNFQKVAGEFGQVEFLDTPIRFVSFTQAKMKVMGIRLGNFAYISDIKEYREEIFDHLAGVETLILSALREESSPVHLNLEESLAFAKKVGAKKTVLTHIAHEMDHEVVSKRLPAGVELAYDGMEVEFGGA